MKIIGIVGLAGSGKDSIANFLKEFDFQRASFADPLKEFCQTALGFTNEQLWGPSKRRSEPHLSGQKVWVCSQCSWYGQPRNDRPRDECPCCSCTTREQPLTARIALQTLGTEWGRALYPNIWVECLMRYIAGKGYSRAVIPDCRFENEAAIIRREGGYVWRVVREGAGTTPGMTAHPSEVEQERIQADLTIYNNGTLYDLQWATEEAWRLCHDHGSRLSSLTSLTASSRAAVPFFKISLENDDV